MIANAKIKKTNDVGVKNAFISEAGGHLNKKAQFCVNAIRCKTV